MTTPRSPFALFPLAAAITVSVISTTATADSVLPTPPQDPVSTKAWTQGRSPELLAILDAHYDWLLRDDPLTASSRGDKRFNTLLRDESPEAYRRRTADTRDRLARLQALIAAQNKNWSEADQTDAELLAHHLKRGIDGERFHAEQMPVSQQHGPQVWLAQMSNSLTFTNAQDYADFAARLEAVPRLIDQHIEHMRLGLAAGRVPPCVALRGTDGQAEAMASPDHEASSSLSLFFKPFLSLPETDKNAVRAATAVKHGIVPAYRRLAAFLRDEYLPRCRDSVGISEGIDGIAVYEHALRGHTTTDMTAEQIHQLGLGEVARLRANMMKAIARTDWVQRDSFAGDELLARFVEFLRTDKRFYCDKPEQLLGGYRDIAKKVDAALPRLFATLPRTPYGVRELPAFAAPTSPTAYYYRGSPQLGLPGFFMANTYRLDQRPRYEMTALTLHEACPGHHLQIALSQELVGQHPIREMFDSTALVEGWGLYAERLGLEMAADGSGELVPRPVEIDGPGTGLYADPYDDFGRLTYEMWRACRLVVDTGIHAKGWTRQRAIDYMLANTALSPHNIEREVDRYIAWPAQACAYKIGQLKISELRERAERTLADKFDIRSFHDCVLGAGAVPLPTLEARVERWMEGRSAR